MAGMFEIEAVKVFEDLAEGVDRKPGDRWKVDDERFEAINSTIYGELAKRVESEPKPKGRPTKAELMAEAEELGIDVPKNATNPQIAELIKEAR